MASCSVACHENSRSWLEWCRSDVGIASNVSFACIGLRHTTMTSMHQMKHVVVHV